MDPLMQAYPWYTPYQFAGNMPIQAIDLDGLEQFKSYTYDPNRARKIKIVRALEVDKTYTLISTKVVREGNPDQFGVYAEVYTEYVGSGFGIQAHIGRTSYNETPAEMYNYIQSFNSPIAKLPSKNIEPLIVPQRDLVLTLKVPDTVVPPRPQPVIVLPNRTTPASNLPVPATVPGPMPTPTPTPRTQPPASVAPIIFSNNETNGWRPGTGYTSGIQRVAQWLADNPEFSIKIISDGTGRPNGVSGVDSFNDIVPGSRGLSNMFFGVSFGDRLDNLLSTYRADIIRAGSNAGVTIDPARVITERGSVKSNKVTTSAVSN